MKTKSKRPPLISMKSVQFLVATLCLFFILVNTAAANMKSPPPTISDTIIIGDRVVDIAYNLGVMPRAMSVRGGMWPMAKKLKMVSQILGCPNCLVNNKTIIPNACKKYGVKHLIVERSTPYCLYKPEVNPENCLSSLQENELTINFVDFSEGLESAIHKTADLLNCSAKADGVIAKYKNTKEKALQKISPKAANKNVVIFNGTFQPSTGKSTLRVEAPGGYSDKFFLDLMGCRNVGDTFKPENGKAQKGHYTVKKTRNGMILSPLITANPDVIIMVGDTFAVERALATAIKANPNLTQVKAIKSMEIYSLPTYIDSGVLEYPNVLTKWTAALAH